MTRLLLTATALELVGERLPSTVTPVVLDAEAAAERAREPSHVIDIAWATGDLFEDRGQLASFFGAIVSSESLRWLQMSSAGVDHPVFATLVERGVLLTTSHVTGGPIAEYVLRAVLEHFQRAGEWRASIADRRWETHEFREVAGTTWLVVGLGAIGTAVAVRARAFGAHVIGSRRTPRGDEPVDELVDPSLAGAVERADVIVLAAPATASTVGLVDAAFLARMRAGSVLVNVARGSLVDEDALLAALDRGVPEVALLDVTATEPLPEDSPLWTHPRVVLTPHSSALGTARHGRAAEVFLENLTAYLDGAPMRHVVTTADLGS